MWSHAVRRVDRHERDDGRKQDTLSAPQATVDTEVILDARKRGRPLMNLNQADDAVGWQADPD